MDTPFEFEVIMEQRICWLLGDRSKFEELQQAHTFALLESAHPQEILFSDFK
jgi:hypothetical protein